MGLLIESTLMSLDGVVEAPWAWAQFDDEAKRLALDNLRGYGAFLMGRTTYEALRGAWAPVRGNDYIDAINAAPKYVVSSALREVDWNAELLGGDVAAEVARLKAERAEPLIKYGTGRLSRTLVEHDLVDEFQFWVFPVRVGRGRHLFDDLDGPAPRLTLTGTRTLNSGVVVLTYSTRAPAGTSAR